MCLSIPDCAGIVDQDVDAAVVFHCGSEELYDAVVGPRVAGDCEGVTACKGDFVGYSTDCGLRGVGIWREGGQGGGIGGGFCGDNHCEIRLLEGVAS